MSDFLGSPDSCSLAQKVVTGQCDICGDCQPEELACGMLNYNTTAAPVTEPPHGEPCESVCTFGGNPASCQARISWSVEHLFQGKDQSCEKAHTLVMRQCPICSGCQVSHTQCASDPVPANDQERVFDCATGAKTEWNRAKQHWCCEHHHLGCDHASQDNDLHFQKKMAEMRFSDGEMQITVGGRRLRVASSALAVLLAAGLLVLFTISIVVRKSGSRDVRRTVNGHYVDEEMQMRQRILMEE